MEGRGGGEKANPRHQQEDLTSESGRADAALLHGPEFSGNQADITDK